MRIKNDRLRFILRDMKSRCNNPKNRAYKWYGEKGITVCQEWSLGISKPFIDWALSNGYKENLTIDRIDNNIGYTPANCRWIPQKIQTRNQISNVKITYLDKQYNTISELVEYYYPNYNKKLYCKIYNRIVTHKWSINKALSNA